jgi:hypothetical protein
MVLESLTEMLMVAKYCIEFRKDPAEWGGQGCYGWPAAILLFSIVDAIGSYEIGGNTKKHFDILNHAEYYNLHLDQEIIDKIYENYRCILTHNAAMPSDHFMDIGSEDSPVFELREGKPFISLCPFAMKSKDAVAKFFQKFGSVAPHSEKVQTILAKKW